MTSLLNSGAPSQRGRSKVLYELVCLVRGTMVQSVFISYRRSDSAGVAGRVFDHLNAALGADQVFMDVDGIPPGVDFHDLLTERMSTCRALLVVIGPNWLSASNEDGQRRLWLDHDYVRMEVARALSRGIRVIPLLVDGAVMPGEGDLPDSLKPLARRNAIQLSHARFSSDMESLARVLLDILKESIAPGTDGLPLLQAYFEGLGDQKPKGVLHFAPDIPPGLARTASLRCQRPDDEEIYLLIDLTIFKNANNALLCTQAGVRIYNDQSIRGKDIDPVFLSYDQIASASIRKTKWPNVLVDDVKLNGGGGLDREVLLDFLLALQTGLRSVKKEHGDVRTLFSA